MLYATMTFWMLVIVFLAHGIYTLWTNLAKPRVINTVLLPGTLIAQLGHIVGLLITGGTVQDTTLIKDNKTAEPTTTPDPQPKIPVVGPIVVAMLPLLSCGFFVHLVLQTLGANIQTTAGEFLVRETLPKNLPEFWDLLRHTITVVEHITAAILNSNFHQWETWAFVYLIICLTVRMAPLPGSQRGAIGAILVLGALAAVIGLATQIPQEKIHQVWNLLSFSVAVLLFLMIVTLVVYGGVSRVKVFTQSK